jgi:CheY-like chemotaxis protein
MVGPVEILLVEDNPGDARLVKEALKESKINNTLHHVVDGEQALEFLHHKGEYDKAPVPDMILLDLNLPKIDGRQVLENIKSDDTLSRIPVAVLSMSQSDEDILKSYDLNANCYISKPVDFEQFVKVVHEIGEFWFSIVQLPDGE